MNTLENLKDLITENYISLEVWTARLGKKEFKLYIKNLKNDLEKQIPEINYLQTKFTRYIKDFEHCGGLSLFSGIYGCKIKVSPNLDWFELKQNCMSFEAKEKKD